MLKLEDLFYVTIAKNRMSADIHCTKKYRTLQESLSEKQLVQFLTSKKITYGIDQKNVSVITQNIDANKFPITIATGEWPKHGKDGLLTYTFERVSEKTVETLNDFRDVMQIPTVHENEPIAVETLPTKGTPGKDVLGKAVPPRPGKRERLVVGRNVRYDEQLHTYFATVEGQVTVQAQKIDVHNVFSVHETLSMKTGNIDFIGSVEIHGDVPTGYSIKAGGDIRVFGLVEAATLMAEGSIYISEGFAGQQKGQVTATGDVYVSYVNQGTIHADQSIFIENAILHSTCYASESIVCRRGNVIGGSLTAGSRIEAYEIGNRLNTKTAISIKQASTTANKEKQLKSRLSTVNKKINQLTLIGEKLQQSTVITSKELTKTRLRHKNSLQQMRRNRTNLLEKLKSFEEQQSSNGQGEISVQRTIHANVSISFGKYERIIHKERNRIKCFMDKNEIRIVSL